jgi:hypothetical protein
MTPPAPRRHVPESGMTIEELIDRLKTFDKDLPVWFTVSDDSETCYQKLTDEYISLEEVQIYSEGDETDHIPSLVFGSRWFLP